MALKKLQIQYPLPQFDIPQKYKADEWPLMEWAYYIKANEKSKTNWKARSNITNNKLQFNICKNLYIAEEYKYFMYYLIEVKKVSLTTFSEYYDRYKILAEYIEKNMMNCTSILDLEDIEHFIKYIESKNIKLVANNGKQVSYSKMEMVQNQRTSRYVTFIPYFQTIIREYYEKEIPETEKLIWCAKNIPFTKDNSSDKRLDFSSIKNPHTLKNVKDFCEYQLKTCSITFAATYKYLHSIKRFINWLDEYNPISDLSKLNRDIVEEYMLSLRTSGKISSHEINVSILNLKVFLEWGEFYEKEYMPHELLMLDTDYAFKTKKESKYLTNDELKNVINIIPTMPKLYGKMLYCLIFLGVRFSELKKLSIDCIKQNDDGGYYLDLFQYKTDAFYEKPVYRNCIRIIQNEIEKNQKRFGENAKYVFVSDKNTLINIKTMNDNINKALINGNILGRDRKILHCTTHQLRATLATNLISEGVAVDVAAQLLGQSTLSSLSHYATITPETVKEQLKPRLEKDERLIRNIGKMEQPEDISTENTVALCNGFCSKDPLTTPCAKANACFSCSLFIPSKQFLNMYEMQLIEIEATIQIAVTNGYNLMLQKALEDKEALENIIKKIERKGDK